MWLMRQRRWHASSSCSRSFVGTGRRERRVTDCRQYDAGRVRGTRPGRPAFRPVSVRSARQVSISDSARVVEDLRRGNADVGFVGARFPGRGLEYLAVAEDEVVLPYPRRTLCLSQGGHLVSCEGGLVDREGGSGRCCASGGALPSRVPSAPLSGCDGAEHQARRSVSAVESGYGMGWVSSLALVGRGSERVTAVQVRGHPFVDNSHGDGEARHVFARGRPFVAWVRERYPMQLSARRRESTPPHSTYIDYRGPLPSPRSSPSRPPALDHNPTGLSVRRARTLPELLARISREATR